MLFIRDRKEVGVIVKNQFADLETLPYQETVLRLP